ncbi:MAG: endonuclease/exonuclease/phosphatase family protein [Candidatus Hydrogenedentota bacterium]
MEEHKSGRGFFKRMVLGCGVLVLLAPLLFVLTACVLALFNGRVGAPTDYSASRLLEEPPPSLSEPLTLKIVTYNIASAYGFTTNRPERMRAIADVLTKLDPDIVGFQEAFVKNDRALLLDELSGSRLQHFVQFPSGTVGNGLLIASAWPIVEHYFHRFEQSNPWYKLWEGDWWAGKGVGLARIELPGGAVVDVYNTHAQAGRRHPTGYREVRTSQMQGLSRFVAETATGSGPAFVVGDFNTKPDRDDLQLAINRLNLERVMSIDSGIDHIFAVSNPQYRFEVLDTQVIKGKVQGSKGHVFLARPPTLKEARSIYFGPGEMTILSDHSGFMSTVRIVPQGAGPKAPQALHAEN